MSDILTDLELDALRLDFYELLGIDNLDTPNPHTTGVIKRVDKGTPNPVTGRYDSPIETIIYSAITHPTLFGAAHMSPILTLRSRQELAGGEQFRIRAYRLLLPWNAPDIWIGDLWEVVSTRDPHLSGRVFTVTDVLYEAELAARRLTVTDDSKDGEGNC